MEERKSCLIVASAHEKGKCKCSLTYSLQLDVIQKFRATICLLLYMLCLKFHNKSLEQNMALLFYYVHYVIIVHRMSKNRIHNIYVMLT